MLSTLFFPGIPTARPASCSNGARESGIMEYPPPTEADADGNAGEEGDDDEPAFPPPTAPDECLSGARWIISCCPCPCACPPPLGAHPDADADGAPLGYDAPPAPG